MKTCRICNDPLLINDTVYCHKPSCKKAGKAIWQRVNKKRLQLQTIVEGKVCKRCNERVYEESMRKYCNKCKTILKAKSYPKKHVAKINKDRPCADCKEPMINPAGNRLRCVHCAKKTQREQAAGHDKVRKKRQLSKTTSKDIYKGTINKMFLTRGKIHSHQITTMTGA